MDTVYLTSLIVGGFFVLLSIFGGGDHESDADHDADLTVDADHDLDASLDVDAHGDPDFVDLFSIRALFLFAAFFGLTGVTLGALGTGEPLNGVLSAMTGLVVGLGGNWFIKRFAYQQVTSQITEQALKGRTARVLLPLSGDRKGRILLESGGRRIELTAQLFDDADSAERDEEVVVVRVNGHIAEVIKPD
jgi:membrane protein implicated in regulation of membrane protease activity